MGPVRPVPGQPVARRPQTFVVGKRPRRQPDPFLLAVAARAARARNDAELPGRQRHRNARRMAPRLVCGADAAYRDVFSIASFLLSWARDRLDLRTDRDDAPMVSESLRVRHLRGNL